MTARAYCAIAGLAQRPDRCLCIVSLAEMEELRSRGYIPVSWESILHWTCKVTMENTGSTEYCPFCLQHLKTRIQKRRLAWMAYPAGLRRPLAGQPA